MIETTSNTLDKLVREVARGYVIDRVRVLAKGHEKLFERALRLYALVEQAVHRDRDKSGRRLRKLAGHPLARTVERLISKRIANIVAAALRGMEDNRRVMAALALRVRRRKVESRAAIEQLYREVLTAEVPLERSLENLQSIVESTDLMHEMLTTRSLFKRLIKREGYAFVRRVVVKDDAIRAELDGLWQELHDHPDELPALAASVTEHGPAVIREIYAES